MNKTIEIRPRDDGWQVWFHVGSQSFPIGSVYTDENSPHELGEVSAQWYAELFEKALAAYVAQETDPIQAELDSLRYILGSRND